MRLSGLQVDVGEQALGHQLVLLPDLHLAEGMVLPRVAMRATASTGPWRTGARKWILISTVLINPPAHEGPEGRATASSARAVIMPPWSRPMELAIPG